MPEPGGAGVSMSRDVHWSEIEGWFGWRSGQKEAVERFPAGSRFVEVGSYLGRSLCSLGEIIEQSGKQIEVIGVDTCRGSGPEGPGARDYHGRRSRAVAAPSRVSCTRTSLPAATRS